MKKKRTGNIGIPKKNMKPGKGAGSLSASGKSFLPLLIVFAVPFFLYIQTVKYDLTDFDDDIIISLNNTFLSDLRNAPQVFLKDAVMVTFSNFYRPIQTLSYIFDSHISGTEHPWAYHLTNILLFSLIACLLYLFLLRFFSSRRLAIAGTLVYCVHPLFTSTVAWLPARGDLLLTFFTLLSFLFLFEQVRKGKLIYLLLHWFFFVLALFCKETAAFLPFVFILYYFVFVYKGKIERKYLLNILLYGIAGLVWLWFRSQSVGPAVKTELFDVGLPAFFKNIRTIPESFSVFFLPVDIEVIPHFTFFNLILGLGLMAAFGFFLFRKTNGRTMKEKAFCISWFILLLLPTMFFKQNLFDYLNHRFLLPFIGILMFLMFLVPADWITTRFTRAAISAGVIVAVFFLVTFNLSKAYSDPMNFYNTAVSENPDSPLVFNNRGLERMNVSDYEGAVEDFNNSIRLNGKLPGSFLNKGVSEYYLKNFAEADSCFTRCLLIAPKNANAYYYKGLIQASYKNIEASIGYFSKAIELDPKYEDAYVKRLIATYVLEDYQGTIEECDRVLKLFPANDKAKQYKSLSLQKLKDGIK